MAKQKEIKNVNPKKVSNNNEVCVDLNTTMKKTKIEETLRTYTGVQSQGSDVRDLSANINLIMGDGNNTEMIDKTMENEQ